MQALLGLSFDGDAKQPLVRAALQQEEEICRKLCLIEGEEEGRRLSRPAGGLPPPAFLLAFAAMFVKISECSGEKNLPPARPLQCPENASQEALEEWKIRRQIAQHGASHKERDALHTKQHEFGGDLFDDAPLDKDITGGMPEAVQDIVTKQARHHGKPLEETQGAQIQLPLLIIDFL